MNLHFLRVEDAVEYALQCLRERRYAFRKQGLHDPVDWLEPFRLAEVLGLEYKLVPTIHLANLHRDDVPVGLLDLSGKRVIVSEEHGSEVARFTGAHELCHYLLHQRKYKKHWERVFDPNRSRPPEEREADAFAGMFLMPEKMLRSRVEANFCSLPIHVNDNVLYFLSGSSFDPDDPESLELEYALAKAHTNFRGEHIIPLHQQFKVSVTAMAIELRRLKTLSYPVTSYRADL